MLCIISDSNVSPFCHKLDHTNASPSPAHTVCSWDLRAHWYEADDSSIIQSESPHKPNDNIAA